MRRVFTRGTWATVIKENESTDFNGWVLVRFDEGDTHHVRESEILTKEEKEMIDDNKIGYNRDTGMVE